MHHAHRYPARLLQVVLLAAIACAGLLAGPVLAQSTASTPAMRSIHIAAGPLARALDELGEQTGALIMYTPDLVAGLNGRAVSGDMVPVDALRQLLSGTGLTWNAVNATTFVLQRSADRPGTDRTQPEGGAAGQAGRGETKELDTVLVVGSRLGASQYESAQPVVLISREDIERSGAGSVAQVLSTRPEVSVNNNGDNAISSGNFNATTVQLRGMPRGTTLVLVNGRRIGNTGPQASLDFFDLNSLPLSLVDHIEILPVGSSAIYGGDALAGVVNIVLKKDAQGFDIGIRQAHADGYSEKQLDFTWGKSWSRGSLTVSGTYRENTGLYESERAITADKDYTRFGGTDNRSRVTNPGNVFSLDGCPPAPISCFVVPREERGNLPGLDAPYAAVPIGSTGEGLTPADFAATAGTLNLRSNIFPIYSPARRYGVLANGNFQLTDKVELFTELTLTRNETDVAGTGVQLIGEYGSYRVPAANPFNPFGVEVGINFVMQGRPDSTLRSDYTRALLGARGTMRSWNWEVAGWQSRNKADQVNFINTADAIRAALASSDPATALNPFEDGPGGSPELIASLFDDRVTPFVTDLRGFNGHVSGPVWELPAGDLEVLLGAEYEKQELSFTSSSNGIKTEGERSKHAVFGEMRAPILANRRDPEAADLLVLTGALRADYDSSFDGRGLSKVAGLEFRPISSLLLRAAYNTAFKPPVLYQAAINPRIGTTDVNDPQRGGALTTVQFTFASGIPDSIKPERGESITVGLVYSPSQVPLNFTVSHWKSRLHDRIVAVSAQFLVDNEQDFPGRVVRDPDSGIITAIDGRPVNVNFVNNAGVDLGLDGQWKTDAGTFFPTLAATYTYEYQTQVSPTSPLVDGVSKAAGAGYAPRWKGTAQLGWERGNLYAQMAARYVSRYRDYDPLSSGPNAGTYAQLGDFWTFDVSLNYALGEALAPGSPWLSRTTLGLSVVNLFDRLPDFSTYAGSGYDASQYDIRGRYVSARLKFSF